MSRRALSGVRRLLTIMATFTPPTAADVPAVFPEDRRNQSPWRHFANGLRGVNVWKLNDGTYTENEPDPEDVALVYLGAHTYTVDASEAAALTAAGYTVT